MKKKILSLVAVVGAVALSLFTGLGTAKGQFLNQPILDMLQAVDPQTNQVVATSNTSLREGLTLGSTLPTYNVSGLTNSLKIRAYPSTSVFTGNLTYGFVWSDSATNVQKYNASAVASLAKYPQFSASPEFTLQINTSNGYYYNKYITVLAYVRNNDGLSELNLGFTGALPLGMEVDDVIPMYFHVMPANVPAFYPVGGFPVGTYNPQINVSAALQGVNLNADQFVDQYNLNISATVSQLYNQYNNPLFPYGYNYSMGNMMYNGTLNLYLSADPVGSTVWQNKLVKSCAINNFNTNTCTTTLTNPQPGKTYYYRAAITGMMGNQNAIWSDIKTITVPFLQNQPFFPTNPTFDNVQPTVNVSAQSIFVTTGGVLDKALRLTATAQDASGPVSSVQIYAYKTGQSSTVPVMTCSNLSSAGSCVVTLPQYQDGDVYFYYARATDIHGNTKVTPVQTFYSPIL